jgi:hypothetical protein
MWSSSNTSRAPVFSVAPILPAPILWRMSVSNVWRPGWAVRLAGVLLVGSFLLWVVHRGSARLERQPEPAGFGNGLLHGALMPMAMPNLLLGQDVTIYASRNRGRSYKLGYTVGVNACGLLFFSLGVWRVKRLRRGLGQK